jgi:phospholipid/cholesterol/gamma-HCH transport system permease protein
MAPLRYSVDGGTARLVPTGAWTVTTAAEVDAALDEVKPDGVQTVDISLGELAELDTTGAFLLVRTARAFEGAGAKPSFTNVSDDRRVLLQAVAQREVGPPPPPEPTHPVSDALAKTGATAQTTMRDFAGYLGFLGEVTIAAGRVALDPRRLRFASIVTQMERAGFQALPIVMLISFLVGVIIAQQGAFQLRRFGAEVFVVNLVGILVLREVGLLLAAIMFAGRSGSAYTAEIGSMRMREEVDAMRVMGLDPVEVLVLPRLIALVLALPIVTVASNFAALFGGLVTCWLYLGIEPPAFLQQLRGALTTTHFMVGLIKAPFMAVIIAVIAAAEGLRVSGSTESLGRHTTASVVKAIFFVIVIDGVFAVAFAWIGW